ncbi:MAG TPA: ATP-dependent metallopeptidase FtsH/Yme1/Tma family protein [Mycobacteriales bacterium]|nr:ATP-dependent metallopeptidase FtsH/Yme1/Tma family protein [Mycobacteriales bacterium]
MRVLPTPRHRAVAAAVMLVVVAGAVTTMVVGRGDGAPRVPLSDAVNAIEAGRVREATIDEGAQVVRLTLADGSKREALYPADFAPELSERLLAKDVRLQTELPRATPLAARIALLAFLLLVLGALLYPMMRGRLRVGAFARGRGELIEVPSTRFSDIAGADEAVLELEELVEVLHDPERYHEAGAKVPHGVLLVGPPGTGKTLLARAVAGEAGVPFFSISGSDFVETFVGVGASRVRAIFDRARKHGRAIIFIDEIDAVGKARGGGGGNGSADEREHTLNQLLVEMDGFTSSGVIVLAATNRNDVLDPALTRPGRFDRVVHVAAPDRKGRTKILELYAKARRMHRDVDLVALARRTPGMTGADLAQLVNAAALTAARESAPEITPSHLDDALATRVLGRERRSATLTDRDRRITAWHEAGHALAAMLLPDADDPVIVTIVPRGPAGGVTWMSGNDNALLTRREASARLVVAMGGRAAEELVLDGDFTQGAAGDFASATSLAWQMVTEYGMSTLGVTRLTPELLAAGTMADTVHATVDQMCTEALDLARALLLTHRPFLEAVAASLLVDETLDLSELRDLEARFGAP